METEAIFRLDGSRVEASRHASGPWDPSHQHGSAPAALVAFAAERIASPQPMQVARITLDLMRPVPIGPLEIATEVVRDGRKIQVCAVRLSAGGVEVVRASVLKVRTAVVVLPDHVSEEPLDLPGPESGWEPRELADSSSAFLASVSIRMVKGAFRQPGPGAMWVRLIRPLIAGEPTTPLIRAAVAADFCNGLSAVLDFRSWTFINGDLTISLARMPAGEWILLDAQTWVGPDGIGLAFARIGDAAGYFGRAIQSIVIERR